MDGQKIFRQVAAVNNYLNLESHIFLPARNLLLAQCSEFLHPASVNLVFSRSRRFGEDVIVTLRLNCARRDVSRRVFGDGQSAMMVFVETCNDKACIDLPGYLVC